MATKRNRFKGGARALEADEIFTGDLAYWKISPQLKTAHSVSDKDIRAAYSRARAIANKRIGRMEEKRAREGIYDEIRPMFPSVRGMDRAQAVNALNEVSRFLSAKRGSLSGIRESNKKIEEGLKKKGINIPKDQIAKFGAFMNAMKKALGINRGDYASQQLADLWQELFDKGKISQKTFEKRVKDLMADIEQGRQEEFTRAERRQVNKELRDNPISTYFDELALDPRTVKAAEKKQEGYQADPGARARRGRSRRRRR